MKHREMRQKTETELFFFTGVFVVGDHKMSLSETFCWVWGADQSRREAEESKAFSGFPVTDTF